ncbi:hypothetical protein K2173_013930 [Erythroxylum novogranatense]|uniref:F-box domain-containing protein n=1 Tax=Erythroxylum novogranatense TaxID=1862640 RepID=A0AAV8SDH1_9ROSI|nr:hypothetical protein K2173_013930 [Erythroxylum novogranatense]
MMDTLPIEIALDILSRLPVTCLTQIKCVCKAWCALGQDPRLSVLYHTRAINKDPCLILHRNSPIRNELYHVSSARVPEGLLNKATRIDSRVTSILPDHNIIGSCNGLLCISDVLHIDPMYILNPFVGSHTRLPRPISYHEQEVTLGFGYHPITKEYKVVRITSYVNKDSYLSLVGWFEESDVQVFTLGMKAWRSIGTIAWRIDGISSEALSNGALHWVTMRREYLPNHSLHIVSFDLGEERFKEIELPSCGSLSSCNFHLISLQGCLSAAVCCPEGQIETADQGSHPSSLRLEEWRNLAGV